ncbi:MAG: serine hydrolase [Chitinophagia bacterium]|nr:serine hydrolase [Chitinophagia bacterium]
MRRGLFLILLMLFTITMEAQSIEEKKLQLKVSILQLVQKQQGTFAIAFKDLRNGDTLFWNEKEMFHAASTMKTPVMIEIFRQAALGNLSLSDTMIIRSEFQSIVDGSWYKLSADDDSDNEVYEQIGKPQTIAYLVERMITRSSNVATNMLMSRVSGDQITNYMRALGAHTIMIRRGVEDNKAYKLGLNNITAAIDLMTIFEQLAKGKAVSNKADEAMIQILEKQFYNDIIPVHLPKNVRVAHKTGWITGVNHDSGIVSLPDGNRYILILLSKNCPDEKAAKQVLSTIAKLLHDFFIIK